MRSCRGGPCSSCSCMGHNSGWEKKGWWACRMNSLCAGAYRALGGLREEQCGFNIVSRGPWCSRHFLQRCNAVDCQQAAPHQQR